MKHLLPAFLLAAAACGGTPETAKTPGGGSGSSAGPAKPAVAGDVSFDVPTIEIKGMLFLPEALERPGMMLSPPKKKTTIEKLRDTVAKTKDLETRQALAIGLATMLYEDSKTNKANADKDVQEARQTLRDAVAAAGDKVDDLTLKFLGVYELLLVDYPGAEKAYAALVAKAPTDKEIATSRAWWAFSLLMQNKNADALAVVKDQPISEKTPELAYVTAWAKFRTGDEAGAWQAIVAAAKGWGPKELANKGAVERDVMLFAARTNTPLADAVPQLTAIFGKDKAKQYETLAQLGLRAYGFAGRWADGVAAVDKAIETAGSTVPANDLPVLRFSEADFIVRLDTPDVAVKVAKQALDALPGCGAKCSDKDKQDIATNIYGMGRLFHLLYATANDQRYYQPAHDLYAATIPLITDPTNKGQAQKDSTVLEQTWKNTKVGTGTHDKQAIGVLLQRHNLEVTACYELALAANPKLGGNLKVDLESDTTGVIKGVSTEPKAGLADMSAVAGCVAERAKTWKLPHRGMPGSTRIHMSYSFGPAKK